MIRRLLSNQPQYDKLAVIEGGRELRYIDLLHKAWEIRPFLPQQQERVAILLPNGGDYIAAVWGVLMAGLTAFPLHSLMTKHELLPLLKQAAVRTVITATAYRHVFEEVSALDVIYIDELAPVGHVHEYKPVDIDADKPMLLLSTSGTTGSSKIVQLSERNVEASVLGYLGKLSLDTEAVRFLLAAPFSSAYGIMIISACLIHSLPLIVLGGDFTLDAFYQAVEKHRVTHYEGSASTILLMEAMAGRSIPHDIRPLKYLGFGGSKVSGGTIEKLIAAYPAMSFYQGYGMTEAAPMIAKHSQNVKLIKTDSVGTAINGVEIAIEAENEITRRPFTQGEIVVRGENVMLGYLDNQSETDRILKNGYLRTGDIGHLDDDGYLYISGRKKNIIIVRGFNVYPEEVEACIQNSTFAKDCIVYGETDEKGRETVCADIVPINPQVSQKEIAAYCGAHLASYKRPQRISFCGSISKNASGKIKRRGV